MAGGWTRKGRNVREEGLEGTHNGFGWRVCLLTVTTEFLLRLNMQTQRCEESCIRRKHSRQQAEIHPHYESTVLLVISSSIWANRAQKHMERSQSKLTLPQSAAPFSHLISVCTSWFLVIERDTGEKFSTPEWTHAQGSIAPLWCGSYRAGTHNQVKLYCKKQRVHVFS